MRYILLVLFTLIATFASAQVQFLGSPTTTVRNRGNFVSDSLFYLPKRQVAPSDTAAMRYAISDSSVYVWTGNAWRRIGRAGASFLSASDTSSMLSPYIRAAGNGLTKSGQSLLVDTAAMATRARVQKAVDSINGNVALKVNISDTASMLSPYIRHAGNGLTKTGQALSVDTAAIATRARVQKGIDSLGAVKGNGTVTSVSAGTGMSFTTITTTGSVAVDTLTLSTRAWRQKGDDSLGAVIATKVNISDTATMLNPYTRGSGTTNYVPKFTGTRTLGNSLIFDNGSNVGIGTASPAYKLDVAGSIGLNYDEALYFRNVSGTGRQVLAYNGNTFLDSKDGYIAFRTDATGTTTERLRITSGGDVGIGTTSPAIYSGWTGVDIRGTNGGHLIVGNTAATNRGEIFTDGNGFNVSAQTNNALILKTNDTDRMRITSAGELLIGTTTDAGAYALQVAGSIYNTTGAVLAASSGNVGIGTTSPAYTLDLSTSNDGRARQWIADVAFLASGNASAGFQVRTINSTTAGVRFVNYANNTEWMRIDASGNVGIGTTTPSEVLHVVGRGRFTTIDSTSSPINVLTSDVNGVIRKTAVPSGGIGGSGTTNYLAKFTASGTVGNSVAFDNGGTELLVNTTTDAGGYALQVAGNGLLKSASSNTPLQIENTAGTLTYANFINTGGSAYIGSANNDLVFTTSVSGTERMRIKSDGEVLIGTTSDAGAYALQVAGNAYVGSGKLDIASNTTYGLGIARTGTSAVAGQIYNSNGILYLGAESSTGGGIFTGSSAYAAVIGSGANYSLQFATNNITRATIDNAGAFLINATSAYNVANKMEVYGAMMVRNSPTSGSLHLDSTQLTINNVTNRTPIQVSSFNLTGSGGNSIVSLSGTWNTTANTTAFDISLTNTASGASSNYMRITDGTNEFKVTKAAEVVTAAPTGGSVRKWKLGEAAVVSPTSPNRTIRVEIDGTVYYIHAKTTND